MGKRILFLVLLLALFAVLYLDYCHIQDVRERTTQAIREKERAEHALRQEVGRLGGQTYTNHGNFRPDGTREAGWATVKVLFRAPVNDEVLTRLVGFERLHSLQLRPERITAKGWGTLTPLTNLRHLELSDASDRCLEGIEALASVQHVVIRFSTITEKGLAHLLKLPSLKKLEINYAPLDDLAAEPLEKFGGGLELLRLQDTEISAVGEAWIRQALPKTTIVCFQDRKLKDRKPVTFDDFD